MTLTDFLLARIAEDETVAEAALCEHWIMSDGDATVGFLERHSPERVLAEIEAKRSIVEQHERNRTDLMRERGLNSRETRVLATVYADHPDYDESWRP